MSAKGRPEREYRSAQREGTPVSAKGRPERFTGQMSRSAQHEGHPVTTRRILGIDPGLRVTGFGLVVVVGTRLQYITSGCIRNPSGTLPDRLKIILRDLGSVIAEHHPTEVVVEKVFVNINPQSTLQLGQARGAAISAAVLADLPVVEYTALQVKQAVVGNGKAAKAQVQEMVMRLLSLPAAPSSDAADALACAICHAHGSATFGAGYRMRRGRMVI